MRRILHIENLDCPVCAEALQGDLQKIKGVFFVQVDYVTQTIRLEYDGEDALQKVIRKTNKFEEVRVLDGNITPSKKETRLKEWMQLFCSAVLLIGGILFDFFGEGQAMQIVAYVFYGLAYLAVGYPVLISTAKNMAKGRIFDENFLMTVASIGAMALGEFAEGVIVVFLYQLGELLQSIAVGSSRKSVAKLMELKVEQAILLVNGEQKIRSPEEVRVGDILLVKTGEKAPVDGVLLDEEALLDMKSLTGEAEYQRKKTGEEILSGSINAGGMYSMKATRPYEDSAVGRILDMVENAAQGKAKPEKFIAKFAKYYTPIVCLLAVGLAAFAPFFNGLIVDGRWYFKDYARWAQSALTFLVISCPCALVISVPLTYFSGIGACAKQGILVKGATYLDALANIHTFAFDKTGTLTEGNFTVRRVIEKEESAAEILAIAAALERGSAHPIAKAFEGIKTGYVAREIIERSGKGLEGTIDGARILLGNRDFLTENGVTVVEVESEYTLVYVAKDGRYLGGIEIGDALKKDAAETISTLKKLGVRRLIMLTGDNAVRAKAVADEVGMDEVKVGLLPDEKLNVAEALKKEGALAYVGDGVNDAPVMTAADCAVSMGKLGSSAAVEASDLVLISDQLKGLPIAVKTAKKTRRIVVQNVAFSIVMKVVFMALGAIGILPLWLAVFADVGVMLLAVINSFRVRI